MAFEELTTKHAQVWSSAPFERVAEIITEMHVALIERLAPQGGEHWLDLGCGTGDVAFHAARAGAIVTGSDLSPARKLLYPVVYGGRRRFGIERRLKRLLDRAGLWTLRR